MKKFKRKDLILEHYRKAIEATVSDNVTGDNITVRVWKPKTMGKLPAFQMRRIMEAEANNLSHYCNPSEYQLPKENGAVWNTGNPDYWVYDMQTVKRMDYKKKCVDIYVCALIMRPFSREAATFYEQRMGLEPWDRLLLMWDSRQFDKEGGYDTSYRGISGWNNVWQCQEDLYRVVDEESDIAEA